MPTSVLGKNFEHILVVKRTDLFQSVPAWQGLCFAYYAEIMSVVLAKRQFILREQAENDDTYKQVIPYVVLRHADSLFVVQRRKTSSEQRLAGLLSLGIGGHIRVSDVVNDHPLDWAQRELSEEISGIHVEQSAFLGFINDDTNAVGRVHFGIVYLIDLSHRMIAINSELKHGQWLPVSTMSTLDHFEPWSQLVLSVMAR